VIGAAPEVGCPFANRCPHVMDICLDVFPDALPIEGGGEVRCHLHTTGPVLNGAPLSEMPSP